MNKKKFAYGGIGTLIVVLLLIWIWQMRHKPAQDIEQKAIVSNVTVAAIEPGDVNDYFEASGIVKANNVSEIASRVMGTIKTVAVHQGQKVSAGQELLTIDNKDLTERLNSAKASYEEAAKALEVAKENKSLADITYSRYKKMAEQKAISGQEFDQIENKKKVADLEFARGQAQVTRAQSALDESKVNHGFAVITAPTDGIVIGKYVDAGSMATPGTPLLALEDVTKFKVEATLDEHLSDIVKEGIPVNIVIDSINIRINAKITEMVPAIDPQARSFVIKSVLPFDLNLPLRSGLYAKVLVPVGKKTALIVPVAAIISKGQLTGVYVVDNLGTVSYRMIRTGKNFDNGVEVLSGLQAGEKVVIKGAEHAVDGGILDNNAKI